MRKLFIVFYMFVIFSLIISYSLTEFGMVNYLKPLWEKQIVSMLKELSRGNFHLLTEDMKNLSDDEVLIYLEKINSKFGYPVTLTTLEDEIFSEAQKTKLLNNEMVLNFDIDRMFKKVEGRKFIIGLGPYDEDKFTGPIDTIFLATFAIIIALFSILWSFFSWRNLNRLAKASAQLGEKNFSARVKVSRFSSLGFLAEIFNSMAKRIEKLINSHRELTNAVSHELLTPVSRIRFDIETLKGEVTTENGLNALNGINNDVDEIEELVKELLAYARFDRDGVQINLSKHEFLPWLKQIIKDFEQCHSGLKVDLNYVEELENYSMTFDTRQLERVFTNILRNGLRFVNKKMSVTFIHTKSVDIIHIDDDGPGIPEEERERVFEPFIRLDESRNRDSGGYGLGLAIVRQIIELHNGKIEISESPDKGARFSIILPFNSPDGKS